jgi:RsmE family RNA methyltransferase
VNIILFERKELEGPIPMNDRRSVHLARVLRRISGDEFDAGIVNGPRGKARVVRIVAPTPQSPGGLVISFVPTCGPERPHPVVLIAGATRPVSARRILREASCLGLAEIWVCGTDRGESSYLASRLWREREFERVLREGAEQAFVTIVPRVRLFPSVAAAGEAAGGSHEKENLLALDNYEAAMSLAEWVPGGGASVLAVGSERGWSDRERRSLELAGFTLVSLGRRVLKTETACVAGITLVLARMGLLGQT